MSCEICGRGACSKSFHSLEEQGDFDKIADEVKERMRTLLIRRIKNLASYSIEGDDGNDYIRLSDVIDEIDNY